MCGSLRRNGLAAGKLKGGVRTLSRGVDESENRAIMCGSLRRNANGYGGKALRPVSRIFDSVRR